MALAVAQVGGNVGTGAGSISATFGSTTTSNSLIVALCHTYNTSGAAAAGDVTDSKTNTYQLALANFGGASAPGISGYYNSAGTRGASHQLTVNLVNSSSDSSNIAMIEITGQDTSTSSSCFDATTAASGTDSSSPWSVTSAAAISGNEIAIYGVTIDTSSVTPFTQPTNYSDIINQGDGGQALVSCASYKNLETGTPSPGATSTHSGTARELFLTFKEASSSASASANPVYADVTVVAANASAGASVALRGVTRSGLRLG